MLHASLPTEANMTTTAVANLSARSTSMHVCKDERGRHMFLKDCMLQQRMHKNRLIINALFRWIIQFKNNKMEPCNLTVIIFCIRPKITGISSDLTKISLKQVGVYLAPMLKWLNFLTCRTGTSTNRPFTNCRSKCMVNRTWLLDN